ncbi:MAG: hypothetical protein HOP33_21560 [Verrucomicrobia bacterium]|nr:hypothetical protein [Verrucomicrobiota bacterium]
MKNKLFTFLALSLLSTLNHPLSTCYAQGTAFTYQGRLNDGPGPATGSYDLQFTIYDSTNSPGTVIAGPLTNSATAVSNGLFTVTLDFGNQFPGADRWLEIGVRTNGGGAFSTLSPRQQLTATPYAVTAGNVTGGVAAGQLTGTISANNLGAGSITTVSLANGAVDSAKILDGTITFADLSSSIGQWAVNGTNVSRSAHGRQDKFMNVSMKCLRERCS